MNAPTLNKQRWVAIPRPDDRVSVILADIEFWHQHQQELDQWCAAHDVMRSGMVVGEMPAEVMTLFALRWS
jgi:hypothetical protein